jgi:aspartate dehydrogenase
MPIQSSLEKSKTNSVTQVPAHKPLTVAIAGTGAIGAALIRKLGDGVVPRVRLTAVATRDHAKGTEMLRKMRLDLPVCRVDELPYYADVVIECAPASVLDRIVEPALSAGKKVIVLSVGALLAHPEFEALANAHGGQIVVPTGALLGLDAVTAAAEGQIKSETMTTRKPIAGLLGAPYLQQRGIEIDGLTTPKLIFKGTAREAAIAFPANINVAAALSLAGIGPDRTVIEIWADPTVVRNTHRVVVDSDAARFEMTIENIPSENPKTSRITALSVIAALRKMTAPIRMGT